MTEPTAAGDAYDPWFLATPLPLPGVPEGVVTVTLPFTHLTVRPVARPAAAT